MPYIITKTNGSTLTTINDFTVDISTSLVLSGRGVPNVGTSFANNLVHLLENFAFNSPPTNPLIGQLWFDTINNVIRVYDNKNNWDYFLTSPDPNNITLSNNNNASKLNAGTLTLMTQSGSGPQLSFQYGKTISSISSSLGISNNTLQYLGNDNLIFQSNTNNQIRLVDQNSIYGTIFRNDGSNFNIISTPAHSPYSSQNVLHPFVMSLSSGKISIENGLSVNNGLTSNDLFLTGSLIATMPSDFKSDLTINGNLYVNNPLYGILSANAIKLNGIDVADWISNISSSLGDYLLLSGGNIIGDISAHNLTLSKSLNANNALIDNDLTVNGNLYLNNDSSGILYANDINLNGIDLTTIISNALLSYLPLSGGNILGDISGVNASFSATLTSNSLKTNQITSNNIIGNVANLTNITSNNIVSSLISSNTANFTNITSTNLSSSNINISGNAKVNGGLIGSISNNPIVYVYSTHQQTGGGMYIFNNNLCFGRMNQNGTPGTSPLAGFDSNGDFLVSNTIIAAKDITAFGDITVLSDIALKENIEIISDGLEIVKKIRGVRYTRKDTKKQSIGVIAQEIQKYLPEVVSDNKGTLSVAYGNMIGVLIEAIKTLSEKVEILETKLKNQ